jgi:MOSC domain
LHFGKRLLSKTREDPGRSYRLRVSPHREPGGSGEIRWRLQIARLQARVARKVVSIINLDSLAALADVVRAPVDPLRFRANVYVAGWPVWSELDSAQRTMRLTTLSRVQGSDRQNLAEKLNH